MGCAVRSSVRCALRELAWTYAESWFWEGRMRIGPPPRKKNFECVVFLRNGGGVHLSIFFFVISEIFFSEKTQKKFDVYALFILFFPRREALTNNQLTR